MKTNQFLRKHVMTRLLFLTTVCFFTVMLHTGCKKETPVKSSTTPGTPLSADLLVADVDETEYTLANYEDALNDVVYDGNRLVFKNFSHFITTALALDSIGDSTANNWFGAWGFTNSLYDEYEQALDNAPEDADEADVVAYFNGETNAVKYDGDNQTWYVNAVDGIIARLLNSEHKVRIGGNIFYSNFDVNVTVGADDEGQIQAYATQGFEQDDENAIVQKNNVGHKTTGSDCLPVGFDIFMGDISCGSPQSKKSDVRMKVSQMKWGSQTTTYMTITVNHKKRGKFGFGFWSAESRGSQVGGWFEGKYFNQAKIYGNQAKSHDYVVYSTLTNLSSICWADIQVCVAPMCNGVTICQNW